MTVRAKWIVAAAVVAVLAGAHVAPLLVTHSEQDTCSFGPVSNARYRELLAEAKRRQAANWPRLPWSNNKAGALLNERFDDLSSDMTSVYERLAAMHAVMRALGGDYRKTDPDEADPYTASTSQGGSGVSFNYNIDLNRLGFFSPLRRQSWMIGSLMVGIHNIPPNLFGRSRLGDISFIVWFPSILESYLAIPRSQSGEFCPRVPSEEWAERLSVIPSKQRQP
jgi:hypothetical protein